MNKRELSQAAMANVLVEFVKDNPAGLGVSKVAAKEANDVVIAYGLIVPKLGGAARVTKEVTKRRAGQKKTFIEILAALLGPTRSLATATNDMDLLALATVSKQTLRRMRPQALVAVGQKLVGQVNTLALALADYAVDAPTLALLQSAYDAYIAGVPQTRQLINARSIDNMTAQELLKALMQQIYELDEAMQIFALRDVTLFAQYQQARTIVDVGPAGPTPPVPPSA